MHSTNFCECVLALFSIRTHILYGLLWSGQVFLHSWCQICYSSKDGVGVFYLDIYIFVVFVAFVSGSVFHGTKVENECTDLGIAANFVSF